MPIAFVSGAYTDTGTTPAASVAAAAPAGIVAGNVLVAVAYIAQNSAGTISAPAGWTLAPSGSSTTVTSAGNMFVYTKVATGSEPATYAFTTGGTTYRYAVAITQFSGTAAVDGACAFHPDSSADVTVTTASVTPGAGSTADYWVTAFGNTNGYAYTTPAGATVAVNGRTAGQECLYVFYTPLSSAAATGAQSSNQAAGSANNNVSLLLLPAVVSVSATGTGAIAFGGAGVASVLTAVTASGTGAIAFAGSGVASQHGTVTAGGTGAITFAGSGIAVVPSPPRSPLFFNPPEWAWQLVEPTTSPPVFVGPLTTATARQLDFPIDAPATAQFTMPGSIDLSGPAPETALIVELATDLYVTRNGRAVFRGRIGTSADTHANDADTVQFTAVDYRGLLDHRIIWPGSQLVFDATHAPNEQTAIAWKLISDTQALTNGDLGITQGHPVGYPGIGTTGITRSRTYTAGVPLGQTLDELANTEDGFEWEVDFNLAFNVFHPQRSRDQTASQVLAYGRGLTAVTSTVNTDAYANAVFYTGHQPETTPWTGNVPVADLPAGAGRWETQVSDPNVVLQATVNEQAKATLVNASQLDPAFTLTMSPAWWEPGDIWLGDLVRVQVDDGRLGGDNAVDVSRRVVDIAITLDDDGTETVVLTANVPTIPIGTTDPPPPPAPGGAGKVPKLSRRLHRVDHRLSKLELVAATAATGGSGVSQLKAGKGIGLSPAGGTGVVTVSNTTPYNNILDFGAQGGTEGATLFDNSAAITAAFSAPQGIVWVPGSNYPLSFGVGTFLGLYNGMFCILGGGGGNQSYGNHPGNGWSTILFFNNPSGFNFDTASRPDYTFNTAQNITLEGIAFKSSGTARVYITNAERVEIRNCSFYNVQLVLGDPATGGVPAGPVGANNVNVTDCLFAASAASWNPVLIQQAQNVVIKGCTITNPGAGPAPLIVLGKAGDTVTNLTIADCTLSVGQAGVPYVQGVGGAVTSVLITGNICLGGGATTTAGMSGGRVSGNLGWADATF